MKRLLLIASCCCVPLLIIGCNSKPEDSTSSGYQPERSSGSTSDPQGVSVVSTADSSETSPAIAGNDSLQQLSPTETVARYISALKDDDWRTAEDLLTQAARDAFYQSRLQPSLPGSATAKVEVTNIRYATQKQERGYVETVWTNSDAQGFGTSYTVDVYVRQEVPGEWRVAGLMMSVDTDEFVFFNFEDASDMLAKTQGQATGGPEVREADAGNTQIR